MNRILLVFVLVILTSGIVHAANLGIEVRSPSDSVVLYDSDSIFGCLFWGTRTETATWGSVAQCDALAGSHPDGVYRFYYSVQPTMYCPGPGPTLVPNTGSWREGPVVTFGNGATYCDNTDPYGLTIGDSLGWHSDDFSVGLSFSDAQHAWRIYTQQQDAAASGAYSAQVIAQTCADTGNPMTCSGSSIVQVGSGDCATSGVDACRLRATFSDFWLNSLATNRTYDIDVTPPTTTISDWSRLPECPSSEARCSGRNWFQNTVGYELTCTDEHSGCDTIWTGSSGSGSVFATDVTGTSGSDEMRPFLVDRSGQAASLVDVVYYSDDNAISDPGNVESLRNAPDVWIDGVAPVTTIAQPTEWSRGDSLSIDVTCTDAGGSGCDTIMYDASNIGTNNVDCSPTDPWNVDGTSVMQTYTAPGTACADDAVCVFSFCAYSTDNVGHDSAIRTVTYSIDRTKPTMDPGDDDFDYDPTPGSGGSPTIDGSTDNWFNDNFDVTVSIVDEGSGIASCQFSTDNINWLDAGCGSGSAVINEDGDVTRTVTFEVTVGSEPGDLCDTEGRDECTIYFRAEDTVGNVMDTYSETVSIDYTRPTCVLEQVVPTGSINFQDYNDLIKTHFYYNQVVGDYDGSGAYRVDASFSDEGLLSGDQVSGIMITEFPALTSPGDTETLPMNNDVTDHPAYSRSLAYAYDDADTYSGVSQIIVTDEAGNIGTCDINVTRVPAGNVVVNDVNFTYNHVSIEDPNDGGFLANFDIEIDAYSTIPGIAIGPAEIRVLNSTGDTVSNLAECGPFDYAVLPSDTPLLGFDYGLYDGDDSSLGYEGSLRNLFAQGPGRCFQPYLVINDSVGSFQIIDPAAWSSIDGDRVIAVDTEPSPSSSRDICGFFGTFDNCNERARYVNGYEVDQYLVSPCESCHRGTVSRSGIDPYTGSSVMILGFGNSVVGIPDGYSDTTDTSSSYRLFNIDASPGREFDITASPIPADDSRYGSQSKVVSIDSSAPFNITTGDPSIGVTNFVIGFRSSECTSSCTLSTDVGLGTCRLDCAGFNGCPEDIPANAAEIEALTACDGLSAGFITNEGGNNYLCCTSTISAGSIGTIGTDFTVNASDIERNERLVYLGGRLVKLVVVTFDRE